MIAYVCITMDSRFVEKLNCNEKDQDQSDQLNFFDRLQLIISLEGN